MSVLERQITAAKHRLWMNRWLRGVSWNLAAVGLLVAVTVFVQRLNGLLLPWNWFGLILVVLAIAPATIWTWWSREGDAFAAAKLDAAAGLRERISSGTYCIGSTDPFFQAVVVDAEKVCSALTVRKHLPLIFPKPFALCLGSALLAALMFLIPPGLNKKADAAQSPDSPAAIEETKIAVKKQLEPLRRLAETTPALAEFKDELERLDNQPTANLTRPEDIRHEALKKIDALADAVKKKQDSDEYEALSPFQRKLRELRSPESADSVTQKLTKSLREGDFKNAKEEIDAIKEQLATLKSEDDKEMVQKLSQQLEELSKQLEQAAKQDSPAEKMEQAGLKKEDVERALESLKKGDLEQLQKQLEEKGMNPQKAQEMAKQLQQQQKAGSMAQQLAQSLRQAAQGTSDSQQGEAMQGLSQAADQLGELEQLQQEMAELNSTMQSLQATRDNLDKPCSKCQGSGTSEGQQCPQCQGGGSPDQKGKGNTGTHMAQGSGGRAPEEKTATGFKIERGKVPTGKGAIIGQFQVDGEQLPGESKADLVEVVAAAERDASDRIQRDRIPRQYQKAIKEHFSNVRKKMGTEQKEPCTDSPDSADGEKSAESSNGDEPQPTP